MRAEHWEPTTKLELIGFGIGFPLFLGLVWASEPGFVFLLDHANLLFHEAGHPILGLFSQPLEPYGGTIGQLVFPVALAVSFWRKGQTLPFAAALIWFFENWLNIAHYMADARALELPLVGGGDHDWNTIFSRWRLLPYDTQIAGIVKIMGWMGIFATSVWGAWRGWRDRKDPEVAMEFPKWN